MRFGWRRVNWLTHELWYKLSFGQGEESRHFHLGAAVEPKGLNLVRNVLMEHEFLYRTAVPIGKAGLLFQNFHLSLEFSGERISHLRLLRDFREFLEKSRRHTSSSLKVNWTFSTGYFLPKANSAIL